MTAKEAGFLLLTSQLGDPARHPLTVAQFRDLTQKMSAMEKPREDRDLEEKDLCAIGCDPAMAQRVLALLSQRELLQAYLTEALKAGCGVLTRVSSGYPRELRSRLELSSPGCIWTKGDIQILKMRKIALVGSRELYPENRAFAAEVGRLAAERGFALVSGNARGADREAQESCLAHGGVVVSILADSLREKREHNGVLYLSENAFDEAFSSQRAHSRNRLIHAFGDATFVAQCGAEKGGTWSGTVQNLKKGWTPVYIFRDQSDAGERLFQMGATQLSLEELSGIIKK